MSSAGDDALSSEVARLCISWMASGNTSADLVASLHRAVKAAERDADRLRETNGRLNRRAQIAEAAVNELATGTGRGKARPVAAEVWQRCVESHGKRCPAVVGRADDLLAATASGSLELAGRDLAACPEHQRSFDAACSRCVDHLRQIKENPQ